MRYPFPPYDCSPKQRRKADERGWSPTALPYNIGLWNSNGIPLRLPETSKSMAWTSIQRPRFSMTRTCSWSSTPAPMASAGIKRSVPRAA